MKEARHQICRLERKEIELKIILLRHTKYQRWYISIYMRNTYLIKRCPCSEQGARYCAIDRLLVSAICRLE